MELYLIQHPMQLIPCLYNSIPIIAIHDKNKTLCVLEVVSPQGPNLQRETASSSEKDQQREKPAVTL